MNGPNPARIARAERRKPRLGVELGLYSVGRDSEHLLGPVQSISRSGLSFLCGANADRLRAADKLDSLALRVRDRRYPFGAAVVARVAERAEQPLTALAFESEQSVLLEELSFALAGDESSAHEPSSERDLSRSEIDASACSLDMFYYKPDRDLFAKCANFRPWVDDLQQKQLYQRLYRITLTSALDHRITIFDPLQRRERSMICFDSNSYLGLHRHPRVVERTIEVLSEVGYGTASAQMLCGTNRYLRELEDELSDFLGREETVVFPTGFAANVGTLGALLRSKDAVLRDRFAHASIHEGCRSSSSKHSRVFAHNDLASLESALLKADAAGCDGKLIVTDGVFSMHGRLAPLPQLTELAQRYGARLMVDDAHGLGVLGAAGRGSEEHWGLPGSIDVLMGTLSKSLGAIGGFVSGSRDLITYLRFYAAAGIFTTSLPSATCAGLHEALRVLRAEPQHRTRLWENIHYFVPALRTLGFIVPDPVSPITTLFMGEQAMMFEFSRALFDAGVKCGNVMYPAVPRGESILRLTLNARHSREDLDQTLAILERIGRKCGLLHRSEQEIKELGRRLRPHDAQRTGASAESERASAPAELE